MWKAPPCWCSAKEKCKEMWTCEWGNRGGSNGWNGVVWKQDASSEWLRAKLASSYTRAIIKQGESDDNMQKHEQASMCTCADFVELHKCIETPVGFTNSVYFYMDCPRQGENTQTTKSSSHRSRDLEIHMYWVHVFLMCVAMQRCRLTMPGTKKSKPPGLRTTACGGLPTWRY